MYCARETENLNVMADDKMTNLILTMGIRFWRTAVDILKIRDLHHCEDVLASLCSVLAIQLKPFNLNQDSDLILSLGVSFWLETVRDQNIKEVTHSKAVISYLQGFLDDIGQEEDEPLQDHDAGEKDMGIEDNTLEVIQFKRSDPEMLNEQDEESVEIKEKDYIDDDSDEYENDWEHPRRRLEQLCLPKPAVSQTIKKSTSNEIIPNLDEKVNKKQIYKCVKPGCPKVFYSQSILGRHYKKFHNDDEQLGLLELHCNRTATS